MWQLLLKVLKFVEWQYNSSLHKRGPNSAPLRRYKSWNTFPELRELVQIFTLWEQKLAHRLKECNSAGNPALIFHLGCTPANRFYNFASLLVLTSSEFYAKMIAFSISPIFTTLTLLFKRSYLARDWRGLHLGSGLSSCVDEKAQHAQAKSPIVCKMYQSGFLLLSCISTNHGLLLPSCVYCWALY